MSSRKVWSGVLPLSILVVLIGGIFLLGRINSKKMKRKLKQSFFVLILLVVAACNLKLDGRPGRSKNIEEAKKRGVFLYRYAVKEDVPVIGEIKEAWIERSWRFTKYNYNDTQISTSDGYQLCANLDEETSNNLFKTWSIKRDSSISSYGLYGRETLAISFSTLASFDTLRFDLYKGDAKKNYNINDFIAVLIFIKTSDE